MIPSPDIATEPCGRSEKPWIILPYQCLTAVAHNVDSDILSQYGPRGLAGRFPDQVSAGWRDMRMA
jgi:hypothetical protein